MTAAQSYNAIRIRCIMEPNWRCDCLGFCLSRESKLSEPHRIPAGAPKWLEKYSWLLASAKIDPARRIADAWRHFRCEKEAQCQRADPADEHDEDDHAPPERIELAGGAT